MRNQVGWNGKRKRRGGSFTPNAGTEWLGFRVPLGLTIIRMAMRYRLDKATRDKLKMINKAKGAERKLRQRTDASWQQKNSWKCILAKAMRTFPTAAEEVMTPTLRHLGFLPQVVLYGYIADFAHPTKRIVVEVDGGVHQTQKDYDAHRDDVFRSHGWKVLRFTNRQVKHSPNEIFDVITKELQ